MDKIKEFWFWLHKKGKPHLLPGIIIKTYRGWVCYVIYNHGCDNKYLGLIEREILSDVIFVLRNYTYDSNHVEYNVWCSPNPSYKKMCYKLFLSNINTFLRTNRGPGYLIIYFDEAFDCLEMVLSPDNMLFGDALNFTKM